jgi:phosphoserine phosphatase RsbU/P
VANPTRSKVRFRERAELLDFLLEASRLTSETLDLDRLLDNVSRIVRDVVPYDLFAILLFNERTQGLAIRYAIGHREEVVRTLVVALHEGIVGEAAATRSAVLVDDVRNDARYLNAMDAVRSELAVPMVARGKLVGVLDVQSTRLKAFSQQERALLSLIGSRVASSIDNARLYRRVDRQNRTMRTLAHLSQEFSSILDLDELLGKIAATVRALINYDAFSILLVDAQHRVLRHRFSVRYDQRVNVDNIPLGKGLTGAAAETREPVRVLDTATDPRYIASHPDIRSEMAVPLIVQDRVVGVLDVESERISYFTEEHQRTLSLLAPQIASSVENARLYEELAAREQRMDQDLKAARKVQRVLLPRVAPELRGLEIALRSRPAREISGDVYDFFEYDDGDAVIVFGDVSGKGAAAALYGAMVSGLMRILAPRRRSPAQLMKSLNEILLERKIDAQYATMLIALWKPAERKLVFANAGSEPPLVWRRGAILKPKVEGVPIGLLDDREYEEVTFPVEADDTILFYSDGVEDQLSTGEENYTRQRLTRLLEREAWLAPQSVVNAIFDDLDAFRGATAITDDQTTVVIKVHS